MTMPYKTMYWYCKVGGAGRFMRGIHRFPSKKAALAFAEEYSAACGYYPAIGNDDPRKLRDQAARDLGLVKVKGALGGTYYE